MLSKSEWKHQNNSENLFKFNSKDTRTMSLTFHCSDVSIVDFETANAGWVNSQYLKTNILLRVFLDFFQ